LKYKVGQIIEVEVVKITFSKDGKMRITLHRGDWENYPTAIVEG